MVGFATLGYIYSSFNGLDTRVHVGFVDALLLFFFRNITQTFAIKHLDVENGYAFVNGKTIGYTSSFSPSLRSLVARSSD